MNVYLCITGITSCDVIQGLELSTVNDGCNVGPTSVWDLVASPGCCCGWPALM